MPKTDDHAGAPALIVFDARRRTYVGLSSGGAYWHVVRPATDQDEGMQGRLICDCPGGRRGVVCWRLRQAIAYESTGVIPRPDVVGDVLPDQVPGQVTLDEVLS